MYALGAVLSVSSSGAFDDFWYGPVTRDDIGPIDPDSAMTIAAFYAAVTYISEDVAKLPLNMYEDLGDAGTRAAGEHELQELLHDQPNRRQTAIEHREMVIAWAMLRGKCVNEIRSGASISAPGRPTRSNVIGAIVPLHPDLVREDTAKDGRRRYHYRDPLKRGKERTLLDDEVYVVRGRQSRSVLDFAGRNVGTILAQDRVARFMFDRGLKHGGVVKAKNKLTDPTRLALRKALDEYSVNGPRAGRPLLLEDGMEWEQVTMTSKDAELLATRQASVADVCRWIRIQPHKIFDLTRSTNNNISAQGIDYVVDSILGWAVRVEQAIRRDLIVADAGGLKRFFAKHILDGLLRGDFDARAKAYALAIMWGWMTRNEVRAKEDLNPLSGLSEPLTPVNMTTNPNGETVVSYEPREQALLGDGLTGDDVSRLKLIAADVADRTIRREMTAMSALAKRTGSDSEAWRVGVGAWYAEHVGYITGTLRVPEHAARRYCAEQAAALISDGSSVMDEWPTDRAEHLAHLAYDERLEAVASDGVTRVRSDRGQPVHVEIHAAPISIAPAQTHIAEGAVQVSVAAAEAPQVHVAPQIYVEPTPVAVHVPPTPRVTKTIERDSRGQITRIHEAS